LSLGLERLLKSVPGFASHGLAIPQKYDELVTYLATREQKHKADVAGLELRQEQLSSEVCLLKAENSDLRTQQDEAMQEANSYHNTGVLGWLVGPRPLKAIVKAINVENNQLKQEKTQLQEHLEQMERTNKKLQQTLAQKQVLIGTLEADYAAFRIQANKSQDKTKQFASEIEHLKKKVVESESLKAIMTDTNVGAQ